MLWNRRLKRKLSFICSNLVLEIDLDWVAPDGNGGLSVLDCVDEVNLHCSPEYFVYFDLQERDLNLANILDSEIQVRGMILTLSAWMRTTTRCFPHSLT